jgi:hypothetical protein
MLAIIYNEILILLSVEIKLLVQRLTFISEQIYRVHLPTVGNKTEGF